MNFRKTTSILKKRKVVFLSVFLAFLVQDRSFIEASVKTTNLWILHHFIHCRRGLHQSIFEGRQLGLLLCRSLLFYFSSLHNRCYQKRLYALVGFRFLWRSQASCKFEWASPWATDWPTWRGRSTRLMSHCRPNPTNRQGTNQARRSSRRMDQKLRKLLCHWRPWVRMCQCFCPLLRRRERSEAKSSPSPSRTQCATSHPLCRTRSTSVWSNKFEAR